MDENNRTNRGSVVFPIILVALGLIFLLNNLGVLEGSVWDSILLLWPLLLIAIGLDGIFRRQGLVGPVFLIGLGAVFLLNNLGYLAFDVWQAVLRLWPVLLIAFGLDIVIGRRSAIWSAVGLLIVLAILAGGLWLFGVQINRGQPLPSETISHPLNGATQAEVVIKPAAGSLRLAAPAGPGNLVEGTVHAFRNEQIRQEFTTSGNTAILNLQGSGATFFSWPDRSGDPWSWDLSLAQDLPLDLEAGLGAGRAEIDLTGMDIRELNVDMGVGETTVILPASGQFQGQIEGAIGQIVIIIPAGVAVRINTDTGLANLSLPDDFQEQDGVYTSPGYATAGERIDLDVSQAIGNIQVRWK